MPTLIIANTQANLCNCHNHNHHFYHCNHHGNNKAQTQKIELNVAEMMNNNPQNNANNCNHTCSIHNDNNPDNNANSNNDNANNGNANNQNHPHFLIRNSSGDTIYEQ